MKGYEVGDCIQGHRIIAEARKISDPVVIVKSVLLEEINQLQPPKRGSVAALLELLLPPLM